MTDNGKLKAQQEMLLLELVRVEREEGRQPKVSDFKGVRDSDRHSYLTYMRAFGSFDAAMVAAGYTPRGRGRPVRM